MRGIGFLVSLLPAITAIAQNWALLNPAYRYNYSDDGTDTISNQIRVMDVDTLGPDSFRYELNLVGVVCDTCLANLGGPCDGCFVRVNQPQFLGYNCIRAGSDWLFLGLDTFLLQNGQGVGASWLFDTTSAITATVDDEWGTEVFGVPDSLRRIVLSTGDSLLISRSFGLLRFRRAGSTLELIGVEGAEVGRTFPDLLDYFDYQPGDELLYKMSSVYQYSWFPPAFDSYYHYWKVVITGRSDIADTVTYATSCASTNMISTDPDNRCNWMDPCGEWMFTTSGILSDHSILGAYPGQVMDESLCYSADQGSEERYLAESGISAIGKTVMRSKTLGIAQGGPSGAFRISQAVAEDVYPLSPIRVNSLYEEGVGLLRVEVVVYSSIIRLSAELVGAIIGGDTVIAPPSINWMVSVDDVQGLESAIHPNPTSDFILLSTSIPGTHITIADLQGRVALHQRIASAGEQIDVRAIPPGVYFLGIEGSRPQRFVIAR